MTVFHQWQRMPPNCIASTEPFCHFVGERIKLFSLGTTCCPQFVKMLHLWRKCLHLQSVTYSCMIQVAPSIISKIGKHQIKFSLTNNLLLFFTYRLAAKSQWGQSQPCYLRRTAASLSCCLRSTQASHEVLATSKRSPLRAKTTPARDCQASPLWTQLSHPKALLHCPLRRKMLWMVREKQLTTLVFVQYT